jgi:sarcosine oxidase subunit beta
VPRVGIVGAGIAGLALALELRRLGAEVTVVEARYPGAGNSTRNVGRVRRMQLTPELTRYSVRAHEKWRRLHRLIGGRNPLVFPATYAWLLYGDDEVERLAPLEQMWRDHEARARLVDAVQVSAALPVLEGGEPPVGAVLGDAAIVHHDAAVFGYLQACQDHGVAIRSGTAALGVLTEAGRVSALKLSDSSVPVDAVVNAAGGRAAEFARLCGLPAPNRPVRREVLVTEPSRPFVTAAVSFYKPSEGWFNQTLRGELVAGVVSPDEPDGMTEASSFRFLGRTARVLLEKAPRLAGLRVIRQWAGVYDMTPDRSPLLGEYAALPGFFAMSGWSGRGFALAPVSAEVLARNLVLDESDPILDLCHPDRFADESHEHAAGDYYSGYGLRTGAQRSEGEARDGEGFQRSRGLTDLEDCH